MDQQQQLDIKNQINQNENFIKQFNHEITKLKTELIPLEDNFITIKKAKYPGIELTKELREKIFNDNPNLRRISIIKKEITNKENNIYKLIVINKTLISTLKNINKIKNKTRVSSEKGVKSNIDVSEEELNQFMAKVQAEEEAMRKLEEEESSKKLEKDEEEMRKLEEEEEEEEMRKLEEEDKRKLEDEEIIRKLEQEEEEKRKLKEEEEAIMKLAEATQEQGEAEAELKAENGIDYIKKGSRNTKKERKEAKRAARRTTRRTARKARRTARRTAKKIAKENSFRSTLITKKNIKTKNIISNPNVVCNAILTTGKNVTKKYYFPSEFPNLTKLKPIT